MGEHYFKNATPHENTTPRGVNQHKVCRRIRRQAAEHKLYLEHVDVCNQVAYFKIMGPKSGQVFFTCYYGIMQPFMHPSYEDFARAAKFMKARHSTPGHIKFIYAVEGVILDGKHRGDIW